MIVIDNEFVTQWKPLIYKLLGKKGRKYTREEMNDLYVDTVIEMMVNARYYNGTYAVGTWIGLQVTSAISKTIKVEHEGRDSMGHVVTSDIPDEVDDTPMDSEDLERLQEQIQPFLCHLEDTERDVFTDRTFHKLSVDDIAILRHMHPKSVSRVMTRAVLKLKSIVHSGRRVSPYQEVSSDVPLETAIMRYDDRHYHTFRMAHFKGMPLVEVSKVNGLSVDCNLQLLEETRQMIQQDYGVSI